MSTITNYNSTRRHRIVFIPYGDILCVLLPIVSQNQMGFMRACGLPPTARVVTVYLESPRNCFGFMVEDESFDICPPGSVAPQMEVTWELVTIVTESVALPEDPAQAKLSLGQ